MKKTLITVLVIIIILCSCSGKDISENGGNQTTDTENSISIGVYNLDTYNPIVSVSDSVEKMSVLIYDSLFKVKGDFSVEGCLCDSYSISNGGKTYTLELKQDIKWHDGSEFDASDVDYTFRMINELENCVYKSRFDNISSYTRSGRYTYIIQLKEANSGFLNLLDIPIIKKNTDCVNGLKEYIPIGTGPYKYTQSDMSRSICLLRNEEYKSGDIPSIERINVKQLPDKSALSAALEAREVDMAVFTAQDMRSYNPKGNFTLVNYSNNILTFIGINTNSPQLADAKVRRAISYAIDREGIVKNVLFGGAEAVNVFVCPKSYLYKNIYSIPRDTQRAMTLIGEAGYIQNENGDMQKDGEKIKFKILTNSQNEMRVKIGKKIEENVKQIGLEAYIEETSYENYISKINTGEYDAFIGEIKIGTDSDLAVFAGPTCCVYNNDVLNDLIQRCRHAENTDEYMSLYSEIIETFLGEMPVIPIAIGTDAVVLSEKIKGCTSPSYTDVFADIASWYIE